MTLRSSVVNFQTLEPQQPQWSLQPQHPPWPQWPLQPHFTKKILILIVGSLLAPKWTILVPFCGTDQLKSNFSLILAPFLSEAVEARQCYFFENWWMKLILSKPPEATSYHNFKKCWSFYLSEPFSFTHFIMRHPVYIFLVYLDYVRASKIKEGCNWGHGLSAAIKIGTPEKTVGASLIALLCLLSSPFL